MLEVQVGMKAGEGRENMKFTPSPTKLVRVINEKDNTVKVVPMNRETRRRLKIGKPRRQIPEQV